MKLVGAGKSDVGRVRSGNEDAFLVDHGRSLFAVADGMGGHQAGEIASHTAIETLRAEFDAEDDISDAIVQANRAVYTKAHSNAEWEGMGTTLTAVAVIGRLAIVGHVGDSRTYLLRDGKLRRVTDDHSLVEQLVREGRLTREQAANHPQRSIITRALGVSSKVQVDTNHVHLHDKDRFLLCSDGLTSMVDDDSLAEVLRKNRDPKRAVSRLIDLANHAGGEDNITAVVLDVQIDPGDPAPNGDTTGTIDLSGGITITQPSRRRRRRQADSENGDASDDGTVRGATETPTPVHNTDDVGTAPLQIPQEERPVDDGLNLADVPSPTPAPQRPAKTGRVAKTRSRSRIILGTLGVTALVLAILGIGYWTVSWYASSNYFVDAAEGSVVIYRGTPGGFLTWDPEIAEVTDLKVDDLSDATTRMVGDQREFDSLSKAQAFVDRLAALSAADRTTQSTMVATSSTLPFIPGVTPPLGATTTTNPASNPTPTPTTVP